ncbi:MAG: hydrogenase expression/formation C-terminal domain-containing protein [Hyphomonadaceae bacterium]
MTTLIFNKPPPTFDEPTSLVAAVVREVATLLARYAGTGEEGAIDLRTLPLTEADRLALREKLGAGEVRARIDAAGASDIEETGIAGVWWIRHEDCEGKLMAEQIAITACPAILAASGEDIAAGLAKLEAILRSEGGGGSAP